MKNKLEATPGCSVGQVQSCLNAFKVSLAEHMAILKGAEDAHSGNLLQAINGLRQDHLRMHRENENRLAAVEERLATVEKKVGIRR